MPKFNPKEYIASRNNKVKLTPGDYEVFVADMELRDGNKAPYYFVKLRVHSGECKGAILTEIVSHSDAPYCRLKLAEFVYSFGFTDPFDTDGDFDQIRSAAMNNQVPIVVTIAYEDVGNDEHDPRLRVKAFHVPEDAFGGQDEFVDQPGSDDDIPF